MHCRILVAAILLPTCAPLAFAEEAAKRLATFRSEVQPLLATYCIDCHGPDSAEAELRLDRLNPDMISGDDADHWHEVLNKLGAGEMPPEEESQPKPAELDKLTTWLTKSLQAAAIAKRGTDGSVVFRRLNRREYNNTLNDLFGIDLDISGMLPPEGPSEDGFTNNGELLVMSPLHFEYYLKIARLYLSKTIAVGPQPKQFGFHYEFKKADDGKLKMISSYLGEREGSPRSGLAVRRGKRRNKEGEKADGDWVTLEPGVRAVGTGIPARQGPKPLLQIRLFDFPSEGVVRIRVKAAALEQKDGRFPYLGVVIGNHLDDGIEIERIGDIVEVRAKPSEPQIYEFIGRLENLPLPFRNKDINNRGDLNQAMVGIWNPYEPEKSNSETPRLAVYSVDFEAPLNEQWPPQNHRDIFVASPHKENEELYARDIFANFLRRAYRRPPTEAELARMVSVWQQYREKPVEPETEPGEVDEAVPGIHVDYFTPHSPDAALATLAQRKPARSLVMPTISLDVPRRKDVDKYALRFSGHLEVEKPGEYTFFLASDDGSRMYLDDRELINNDGLHGMSEKQATAVLEPGWHRFALTYFNGGGGQGLKVQWSGPGFKRQEIPAKALATTPGGPLVQAVAQTFEESIRDVLPAALISPAFLYLVEPSSENSPRSLTDHELASRLSYFLWSTMPDEQLTGLAESGSLSDAKTLRQQVRRMLQDPRSEEFVNNFVDQWLELDALERVAVNRDLFRNFMPFMKEAMRDETRAFFAECLHHDLSAMNLIDADFLVINPLLAKHYGIEGVQGTEFQRIKATDSRRGGVLMQGAILIGNSNGSESHPIKRGVWLLKKLLNDPPPPPPPNVPDLDREDPKLSGLSLKEQLEAHREHVACNSCHRKIDPWGIPFEQFGPIGQLRERTRKGNHPVVTDTVLPDGTKVNGVTELAQYLVREKSEQIGRAITTKLLAYALGRSLSFADQQDIDKLSQSFRDSDYRLRHLIEEIVVSRLFMTK